MAIADPAPPSVRASSTPRRSTELAGAAGDAPRLAYYPALDGLRAVAVLGVLFFHAGWEHATGGFLGVSTFFTLSGFLITSLLLREKAARGAIDARRFWSRRFRRLMPAAWITLLITVVYGSGLLDSIGFAADAGQLDNLRGDVLAALAYVANWRFIFDTQSYADLFSGESPVLHFWSLAIEEQFYVLFPVLVMVVLGLRRGRRNLAIVLAALCAASLLAALTLGLSDDRIYFGTGTRASELLLGALLALVLHRSGSMQPGGRGTRRVVAAVGVVALAGTVAIWVTSSISSPWLYDGGFTLYALISVAVILACLQDRGPIAWLLARPALVWLGGISYGVYLYHWILFLWLRQRGSLPLGFATVALDTWWKLLLAGGGLAVAAAALSSAVVEQPIRRRRLVTARQARVIVPVAAVGLVVALFVVTADPPSPAIDFAAAQARLDAQEIPSIDAATRAAELDALTPPEPPPPRISVFGDSTALLTATGFNEWMTESGEAVPVGGNTWLGCSLGRGGERRIAAGVARPPEGCDDWATTWAAAIAEGQPDVAVVEIGLWEVVDRKLPGDDQWRAPGDPVYDEFLLGEMREAIQVLSAQGALVVWLTSPLPGDIDDDLVGEISPEHVVRLNELMRQAVAEQPEVSVVVEYGDYVDQHDDGSLRPDGVHTSTESAMEISGAFLGGQVVDLFDARYLDQWQRDRSEPPLPDPLRVLVVGDSTAGQLYIGLDEHNRAADAGIWPVWAGEYGCGLARGGRVLYQGVEGPVPPECDWEPRFAEAVADFAPHVVVVLDGPFDVADRLFDGSPDWVTAGDPTYDAYLRSEFDAAADLLTSDGAALVWLTSPLIELGRQEVPPPDEPYPVSDPARMAALNEIIGDLAADRDDTYLADYADHLRTAPGGELDPAVRPDGVHLTPATAMPVAEWLIPQLERAYRDLHGGG